ncbi:MAG: rhamnogalacturonan lyase [Prevotella sp.]|nr:rhamnogalacturonan lyase [Prevotella sp.]
MNRLRKLSIAVLAAFAAGAGAQNTPVSQMEKLSRGLVVVPAASGTGRFISWRMLGTDNDSTVFEVLANGASMKKDITGTTSCLDRTGQASTKYQVVTCQAGGVRDTTDAVTSWSDIYLSLPLERPAGGTLDGEAYTYSPNDCSVGDVDGDGNYEIILKWDPSNSKDNSQGGKTANVYLDCYKLDGTKLWRIDLGPNIRAGAHYTQFLVYDFDGDGRSELICKTAPGSIDGKGAYVNQAATDDEIKNADNTKDHRSSAGRINSGQEYLTAFDGETGAALHTIFYNPNRNGTYGGDKAGTFNWDDRSGRTDNGSYGNRGERYLATVAYLDGPESNASAVMCRGYYTYAFVWAVDFDGKELKHKWLHYSRSTKEVDVTDAGWNKRTEKYTTNTRGGAGSFTAYGNGNHNLSCADVDGDGCDEIVWGSAAIDNDGSLLYATGYGHGDAIHLSDLIPDRPGLEVLQVHESKDNYHGWDLHDAATGEIIHNAIIANSDNGRGLAADMDAEYRGFEFCSASDRAVRNAQTGNTISTGQTSVNFRGYWDGDLQDELVDGNKMDKWNGNGTSRVYPKAGKNFYDIASSSSCNGSKATPNLLADILGDWREEIIYWNGGTSSHLNIFTTNVETQFRVPTLMHDHTYRMAVTWQNTAYNQPPHLGYYLPDQFATEYVLLGPGAMEQTVDKGDSIKTIMLTWKNSAAASLLKSVAPDGTVKNGAAPDGFSCSRSYVSKTLTIEGAPQQTGTYEFILKSGANVVDKSFRMDTIRIHSVESTAIEAVTGAEAGEWVKVLSGGTVSDNIVLGFALRKPQTVKIGIYSMTGAKVFGCDWFAGNGAPLEISGLGRLTGGVYMLRVDSSEGTFARKFIKR